MDFLLVYPEAPEVGDFPFFATTVNEAGLGAATALRPGRLLVARRPPDAGGPHGGEALAAAVTNLGAGARGAIIPAGLVEPDPAELAALADAAADVPLRLENEFGQVLAIAGNGESLGAGVQDSFAGCLDVLGPDLFREDEPSVSIRVECAGSWSAAVRDAQWRTAETMQADGVLVEDPETLWVDPTCRVAPGARIGPSVQLTGTTRIRAGARIGAFCRIEDSEIGAGASVQSHSVVVGSTIGRRARVGPFAHIRPDTRLEAEAFAGAFTETKNAVLGRNSALPHLSYLGDADVGNRVNLGAGVITCNYDGRDKHRTVVEAGAFVGSNGILVAPVTVGRRAFVAAGSVIVEDVPEGSMAIARGRQVNKPGRASGRFEGAEEI